MPDQLTSHDARLRSILTELSMGRLTVDEACAQIDDLDRPVPGAKKQQPLSIGAGIVVLLFGSIFGGVGGIFAAKSLSFTHDAGHVEGEVVRHERSGNKGNRLPIVRYEVDGKPYELRGEIASGSPPSVHSKVTVLYKLADPGQAQIDSFVQRWLFPLIFCGIGGLVGLVGLTLVIRGLLAKLFPPGTGDPQRFTV
jgi:hypothetical protein